MCNRTADTCPFLFDSVSDWHKTQEISEYCWFETRNTHIMFPNSHTTSCKKHVTHMPIYLYGFLMH